MKLHLLIFGFLGSLVTLPVLAFNEKTFESDGFDKIVIDYTVTVWGHAFYQKFSAEMRDESQAISFDSLKVEELLFQTGSKIKIAYDNRIILEIMIFPGGRDIERKAKIAAGAVKQRIYNQNMEERFFPNLDFGKADF